MYQNTKIVATLGPASESKEMMMDLVKAGVDVFRINMSHGDHKEVEKIITRINDLNKDLSIHVGILADLQGPKLRVGKIKNDSMAITPGQILTFVNEPCIGDEEKI